MNPKELFRKVSQFGSRKRRLRDSLIRNSADLKPGKWIIQDSSIARHSSLARVPGEIVGSKSSSRRGNMKFFLVLRRMFVRILLPATCRISAKSQSAQELFEVSGRAIAVLSRSGKLLIFDRSNRQVIHIGASGVSNVGSIHGRRALGRFFPVPTFSVHRQGVKIVEDWVAGYPFSEVGQDRRLKVVSELVERTRTAVTSSQLGASPEFWRSVSEHWPSLAWPQAAEEYLLQNGSRVLSAAESILFAPAHGDLSGNNIIVADGEWYLIDLEECADLPAYFDVFFLAHQELLAGRPDIWRAIFEIGPFSTYPAAALGKECLGLLSVADWAVAMLLVQCYMWRDKNGAPCLSGEKLAQWWAPVAESLLVKVRLK